MPLMPPVRLPIRQNGINIPTCLSIVYIMVRYERFAGGKDCDMTMDTPLTKSGSFSDQLAYQWKGHISRSLQYGE